MDPLSAPQDNDKLHIKKISAQEVVPCCSLLRDASCTSFVRQSNIHLLFFHWLENLVEIKALLLSTPYFQQL